MKPLFALALLVALSACREHHHHATTEAAPPAALEGKNAVQQEMQLLTATLEGAVRGIGLGDVRPVEHALHRLHAAKEATDAALESGAYRLPKNPDGVEAFRALDSAFHADLGKLVAASRANDAPAAAEALGTLMRGCAGCHAQFRD